MKNANLPLLLLLTLLCWGKPVSAALITTDIIHVSGNIWEYHYSIENDSALNLEQFALYFPSDSYQNLVDISTLADWDILLFQPGALFPEDDGIFDALTLGAGIAAGDILTGFAVRFTFIGEGNLGGQLFEVFDPLNFEAGPISSGQTPEVAIPSTVASPQTVWLFLLSVAILIASRRYRYQHKQQTAAVI